MSRRGTIAEIAHHLVVALKPFMHVVATPDNFIQFMARLGWNANNMPVAFPNIGININASLAKLELWGDEPPVGDALALLADVKAIFDNIRSLGPGDAPGGVDPTIFIAEIKERLFEILLTDYLVNNFQVGFNFFRSAGIIEQEMFHASATRPSFVRLKFNWDKFAALISKPGDIPKIVFKWGLDNFDFELLALTLANIFVTYRFPVTVGITDQTLIKNYSGISHDDPGLTVKIPFFYINIAGKSEELAIAIISLPPGPGQKPGLIIQPMVPSKVDKTIRLTDKINLMIRAGTDLTSLFGILIRTDGITVKYPFDSAKSIPSAGVGLGFEFKQNEPTLLLGRPKETRIEVKEVSVGFAVDFRDNKLETTLSGDMRGFAVVISPGQGDSFLKKIVGNNDIRVEASISIDWSSLHGIKFRGGGGFEIGMHPNISLGPIAIKALLIRLFVPADKTDTIRLETGADIKGELGPITFVIENIGFGVETKLRPGNAGPFGIDLGFKPPKGVGLSLNAGGFKGGGFLSLDRPKGEYAGALELTFQDIISVKAVGILSTKMPDGSDGFSLLLIITAEFTPIQIGFGFTLIGVGGLIGINRTYLVEVLRPGVKDGSLNSVLFPRDVLANAPRIIGDLRRIFPPKDGHFLIGPMGKLGWGVPTLISLELGLLLEIPRPGFAILGVLRINMPEERLAIVNIQVNFLGIVDFEKGQISFDASLFDSRILMYPLTGDMVLRIFYKGNANFLLSVGGFHPSYTPPPMDLPRMTRLTITIFAGNPSLRAEAYFAVTSNTVQFGALAELRFDVGVGLVYGFIGFDVLIHLNPFYFIAQVSAMLAVEVAGYVICSITINIILEGPTPLHAKGNASFKIGFIIKVSIPVSIEVTLGEDKKQLLPPVHVIDELKKAIDNTANWKALLPKGTSLNVVLADRPPLDANTILLHPFGVLHITQKLVPLGIAIDKYGAQRPDKDRQFDFSEVLFNTSASSTSNVPEDFASAQFWEMTDADKLSRPSFEKKKGGVEAGGNNSAKASRVVNEKVVYEVIYVPDKRPKRYHRLGDSLLESMFKGGAVALSALSKRNSSTSPLAPRPVTYEIEKYAVANMNDMTLHQEHLVFDSEAEAMVSMKTIIRNNPSMQSELQVIPTYQMNLN